MRIRFRRFTAILTIALVTPLTACGGGGSPTDPGGNGGDPSPEPNTVLNAGQLQDNEKDSGRPGVIRIYDPSDSSLVDEIETDAQGNYSETELSAAVDSYLIQARIVENGEPESFVRTVSGDLNTSDEIPSLTLRAVPYDSLDKIDVTPQQFRDYMDAGQFLSARADAGLRKWIFGDAVPEGFSAQPVHYVITPQNPVTKEDGTPRGEFTQEEIDEIRSTILNEASCLIEGRQPEIVAGDDSKYKVFGNDDHVTGVDGWVAISPDSVMGPEGQGVSGDVNDDGVYDRGSVRLDNTEIDLLSERGSHLINEEVGTTLVFRADIGASQLEEHTVFAGLSTLPEPGDIIDCQKNGHLVNEPNYKPGAQIEEVLALDFF